MRSGPSEPVWLVDPKRSPIGFWFIYACGVLQLFGAGALVYDGGATGLALSVVLLLSGLLFLTVAGVLRAVKGGVAWFPSSQEVALFGRNWNDRVAFPLSSLVGLRVARREEYWGRSLQAVFVSSVELLTSTGLSIFLVEYPSLQEATEAAVLFRQVLKLPLLDTDQAAEPVERSDQVTSNYESTGDASPFEGSESVAQFRLSTGVRWALSSTILLLALFCLVSGALLLAGLKYTGVLGFLFGPLAATFGLCLLALWIYKALGAEQVLLRPGEIEHSYHLGPLSWGRQTLRVDNEPPTFRLKSRGAQGFLLDIVCGREMLVVGSGATVASRLPPSALLDLASQMRYHCKRFRPRGRKNDGGAHDA